MWFPDRFAAVSTPPAGTPGDPGANRDGHVKRPRRARPRSRGPGRAPRRPARLAPRAATPTRWCAGRRCRARRCATAGGRSATSSSPARRTRRSSAPPPRRCRSASPRSRRPPSSTRAGRSRGAHRDHAGGRRGHRRPHRAGGVVEPGGGPHRRGRRWPAMPSPQSDRRWRRRGRTTRGGNALAVRAGRSPPPPAPVQLVNSLPERADTLDSSSRVDLPERRRALTARPVEPSFRPWLPAWRVEAATGMTSPGGLRQEEAPCMTRRSEAAASPAGRP